MDSGARARTTLWLRAERAMGVESVPLRVGDLADLALPARPVATARTVNPARPVPPAAGVTPEPKSLREDEVKKKVQGFASVVVPALAVSTPFTTAVLPSEKKMHELTQLDAKFVKGCTRCELCKTRTNTVFGEGDVDAKIFFVGEGPGENEDLTGRPFVGRAGQLLDKMIAGMGLSREQVYIANIVKCRPPGNRVPQPDEAVTCMPYLDRQIEIVRPSVIVTLGLSSAKYLLGDPKLAMGKIRGQWTQWRGIKLMPTFHPSYVLRVYTPEVRGMVWADLKLVMDELGLKKRPAE